VRKKLAIFVVLMLLVSVTAGAGNYPTLQPLTPAPIMWSGTMIDETPVAWFVELSGSPLVEGGNYTALCKEKDAFRSQVKDAKLKVKERFAFDSLWNGFSVSVAPEDVDKLSLIPGVKALYPVVLFSLPPVYPTETPELFTALAMTGADYAQNELGFTGKGIKVGVIDTGIDYTHPDLGGGFGPGYRVYTGYDFVGDAFDANPANATFNPIAAPKLDPMDKAGHGTHVAGIVGAKGRVKGVAPEVTFGAYKVFGTVGSTTADVILAAMERALADDMDVINMSIGAAFQWPQYPTAVASDRLVRKGVVVVASIGNSGTSGLYAVGAPGVGKDVIGVASFDNSHVYLPSFTVSPGGNAVGYTAATAAPAPPKSGTFAMARTGTKTSLADAANPLPAGSLIDKVALIRRGSVSFYQKALNAQNAGARGVVLYNNAPGSVSPTVAGAVPITIPVVMISQVEGEQIDDLFTAGHTVGITWTENMVSSPNATGGRISSFSSYGLAPDLSLKPDLGAPGGQIYSAYPMALGGYATLSGTSMSSPHVAGAAALLLQARPEISAKAVRTILQNAAQPKNWQGNPGLGYLDQVHRQGAGMINITDAILATTKIEPSKLALGESEFGPSVSTISIENDGPSAVTYTLSHTPALATGPNSFLVSAQAGFATVEFSVPSITIAAGATATVQATVTAPGLAEGALYGGYLVFTGSDERILRVPYAGYKGDYQKRIVLTPTANIFPWLASLEGGSYYKQGDATFTFTNGDIPYFLVHFDHHPQLFKAEVYETGTGKYMHQAFEYKYLPRNSTAGGFFAFAWNGVVTKGNKESMIPNGSYVVKLSVLKALGDASNPEHWEMWTSPVIKVENGENPVDKPIGNDKAEAPKDK